MYHYRKKSETYVILQDNRRMYCSICTMQHLHRHLLKQFFQPGDCNTPPPPAGTCQRTVGVHASQDRLYKVVPLRSIEAHLGDRRYSSYSVLTSALEGGEWSASRPGSALPPGKEPPVPIV
jgi:hypothetical protein